MPGFHGQHEILLDGFRLLSFVACPLGRDLVGQHGRYLKVIESRLWLYCLVEHRMSIYLLDCWVICLVLDGSCFFVTGHRSRFPRYRTGVYLPDQWLWRDSTSFLRGLVCGSLGLCVAEFLGVSVVIMALPDLSLLKPVSEILLVCWWIDLPREYGFENSAI